MSNILFVGRKTDGYFAEEVAKELKFGYLQIDANYSIKTTTQEVMRITMMKKMTFDYVIYDLECFNDEAEDIASELRTVANYWEAVPIAYMPSFIKGSVMAQALLAQDIRYYISSGDAADLKKQLSNTISGYYDIHKRQEVQEAEEYQQTMNLQMEKCHSVGVAGTQSRIGTTTQAIQIVQYLKAKGYKACYIELNHTEYLDFSPRSGEIQGATLVEKYRLWNELPKHSAQKLSYKGVEMFSGQEQLSELKNQNYDFYVYDYGSFMEREFDRTAFLKDDVKIIVAGAKAQEFDYLDRFLSVPSYKDVGVILSFVPEEEQSEVMKPIAQTKDWGQEGGRAFAFAKYTPNPFLLSDMEMYEKLIPIEETEEVKAAQEQTPKKKGFFRRKEK